MDRKATIHWYESMGMNPSEGKIILFLLNNLLRQNNLRSWHVR